MLHLMGKKLYICKNLWLEGVSAFFFVEEARICMCLDVIFTGFRAEVEAYNALDPAVRVVILKALCDIRVEVTFMMVDILFLISIASVPEVLALKNLQQAFFSPL